MREAAAQLRYATHQMVGHIVVGVLVEERRRECEVDHEARRKFNEVAAAVEDDLRLLLTDPADPRVLSALQAVLPPSGGDLRGGHQAAGQPARPA
ncbi:MULTISPECIES: hypothetical protein [unclassified Streptomyces]|uniref:hypothetical protein n=1 Tax=unclassified Streptomyces TaxID=2593676 RepID=UPI0018FEF564|nr:hypothetical protein [Streptomyces sp. Root264]